MPTLVLIVALLAPLPTAAAALKLAVLPLSSSHLPAETVHVLDDLLTTTIYELGVYEVTSANDINAMLGLDKMKDALGCNNASCAAEIGGALGVDLLVSGSVGKLGGELFVTLSLIDIKQRHAPIRCQKRVEDDEKLYARAIEEAVIELIGKTPLAATPPATSKTPATQPSTPTEPKPPWQALGLSQADFERYQAHERAATAAKHAPLSAKEWREATAKTRDEWLAFFRWREARLGSLPPGKDAPSFAAWRTETQLASLRVVSDPPGASIVIGGKEVGVTPAHLGGLEPGERQVTLILGGYATYFGVVQLVTGAEAVLSAPLVSETGMIRARRLSGGIATASLAALALAGSAALFATAPSLKDIKAHEYAQYLVQYAEKGTMANYGPVQAVMTRQNALIISGAVLAGVAAGLAAASIGLFASAPKAPTTSVGVALLPSGVSVALSDPRW